MPFKKILVAVNSSPFSLKAAKVGFDLAYAVNADVALLYVIDRSKESVNIEAGPTSKESEMMLLKEAQDTIEQLIKMYNGSKQLYKFTPIGFPKEEILNFAKEWKADLIVMGTHGRKGLAHLFNGSTAEDVIKNASIPVLIIPPNLDK
jgi:nucleotide-binding universal stress UspA family protein